MSAVHETPSLPPDPPPSHHPDPASDRHRPRRLVAKMVVGMLGLTVLIGALAYLLEPVIVGVGESFVANLGMPGVFLGVLLTDTFFLANEPILGIAYAGGMRFWPVAAVACVASMLAGVLGWMLGRGLGLHPWIKRRVDKNGIHPLMVRWGVWAVAVAALSPVPYGAATWAAGAAGVPARVVVLGSLFRIPRVVLYFWLVVSVWDQVVGA